MTAKKPLHGFRLARAQQSIVDKNAGQLIADGLMHQRRRYGRIHTATEAQDDTGFTHLLADLPARPFDERTHRPLRLTTANSMNEIFENLLSTGCMRHLGMKLETVNASLDISDDRAGGILRPAQGSEPFGKFRDLVSVTIPDIEFRREAAKEIGSPVYLQFSGTILTLRGPLDVPTEVKGEKLQTIANPENGRTQLVDVLVEPRSIGRVNARRTTGKNNPLRHSGANCEAGVQYGRISE